MEGASHSMSRAFDVLGQKKQNTVPDKVTASGSGEDPAGFPVTPGSFRKLDLRLSPKSRVIFYCESAGIAAEQYRLLRGKLTSRFPQGAKLLITSPTEGDGKTLNAINLAWALAEINHPTLLLEGDLRRPGVAGALGCSTPHGVEAALLGQIEPEKTVRFVNGLPLHVATVAVAQKDASRALSGEGGAAYLGWAKRHFSWIVIDAPPVYPAADVAELSCLADGIILVVRARSTPRELLLKSLEALQDGLLGVILNEATECLDNDYRYFGKYYRDGK